MKTYNVMAEIHQYYEINANSPEEAQMKAFKYWQSGDLAIDDSPIFYCEEADLIEEEEA